MPHHYTAYIDEAGDEGFGKLAAGPLGGQSRWLTLGACVATRASDLKFPVWRDEILAHFPKRRTRDLHFRHLNHDQKVVVCQSLAALPIGVCVVMSHKATIAGSRFEPVFKQKGYLYNYLVRWLLERVSAACVRRSHPEPATLRIVFSRRGGTDYQSMLDYFRLMRDGGEKMTPVRRIAWSVIDFGQIHVENHAKWAGLQLADCVTSAFHTAVEPNAYGNYEPSYANLLKGRLIREHGAALNCGITVVPSLYHARLDNRQIEILKDLNRGQAPGS